MINELFVTRRTFLRGATTVAAGAFASSEGGLQAAVADEAGDKVASAGAPAIATRANMTGAYGPWLAETVLGDRPGLLSLRSGRFANVKEWRIAARKRVLECIAPVNLGGVPEVRVDERQEFDGLMIERLSWQLPCGPRTEAVLLKPAAATGRLPGILALHDHGGNKFLG